MSGWRHAKESLLVRWCMAPGAAAGWCTCQNPQPDPDSPCGHERCDDGTGHWSWTEPGTLPEPGAFCAHEGRFDCHPHVPTRCLSCHHPIEATA